MADEEVGNEEVTSKSEEKHSPGGRRASSPYHQKCFPPYCESAVAVDKQSISKLKRADLEDKYIVYADENLALKKRMRDHEKQIQRLTVALARQDQADRKTGVKKAYDTIRADNLDSENKHLRAKVKVLTQQLMNHSFIHSKDNRIADERTRRTSPQPSNRDVTQSESVSPVRRQDENSTLKQRIAVLEQTLETQKKKYKTRISQLEKELHSGSKVSVDLGDQISQHSKQLNGNLEIIKLRRQNNELAEKLEALKDQLTVNEKELSQVRAAMKDAVDKAEELESKLKLEREKAREAQGLAVKSMSNTEIIKGLEEQIRDLQKEKEVLKETNEKLLELTTGPQSKSDRSLHEAKLKQQISFLENRLKEKMKELEEKEEQFIKMEALYEESKHQPVDKVESETQKSHHKEEIEELKNQLILALDENEDMKKTLAKLKESLEAGPQESTDQKALLEENEKLHRELEEIHSQDDQEKAELKTKLESALQEIKHLNNLINERSEEREQRLSLPRSERSTSTTLVIHKTSSEKVQISGDDCDDLKAQLCSALIDNQKLRMALEKAEPAVVHTDVVKDRELEEQLASATAEVDRLKKIAAEHELCPKKSKVTIKEKSPVLTPVPSQTVHTDVVKDRELEEQLASATAEVDRLKRIAAEHELCPKKSKVTIKEKSPVPTPVPSQTGQRTYSEHQIQELPPEPVLKPNLVIVSKHEFDTILLNKKKYYTESEATVLGDGKEILNCKMEICIFDLEMDHEMLDYLRDMEQDPHVFVDWSFLGLDQRTIAMPAGQAQFHTNVVYFGPLSHNMSEYVKENIMPIYLMLAKSNNQGQIVGTGELDLFPAITNPGRAYMRSVHLTVDKGSATVYCSFKMHGCCPGAPTKGDSIEVAIGHLQLKNAEEIPEKLTHLYVEYSLLGYCGSELETDSIPKSDVMKFNYNKKLRVTDHNAPNLEPLLQNDNPRPLKFILLSEPCSLSQNTEVEEVGTAEVNLMKEMVNKDKDLISAHLPVTNMNGDELGTLSVTIIGVETLVEHSEGKRNEKQR